MTTFLALLTKELRLRLRNERTVWLLVAYVILLALLGWAVLQLSATANGSGSFSTGNLLYKFMADFQLLLILFTVPAYTATSINGEKERQTFDLLLCSQLSAFSLVLGKLVAGLVNSLLLILAAIPVFSMILFFGGVAPIALLGTLLIYIVTALLVASLGLFCSILFRRPAGSTVVTYLCCIVWILLPDTIVDFLWRAITAQAPSSDQAVFFQLWGPINALDSISASSYVYVPHWLIVPGWLIYVLLNLLVSSILIVLSAWLIRPKKVRISRDRWGKPVPEGTEAIA